MSEEDLTTAELREHDELVDRLLESLSEAEWAEFAAMRDRFARAESHGSWFSPPPVKRPEGELNYFPYVQYTDDMEAVRAFLHRLASEAPYRWMDWRVGKPSDPQELADRPVHDAVRMAVGVTRNDRFNEGALLAAANSGWLLAVLDRLSVWHSDAKL